MTDIPALVARVRQAVETKNALSLYWFQSDILALCRAVEEAQQQVVILAADQEFNKRVLGELEVERDAAREALRQANERGDRWSLLAQEMDAERHQGNGPLSALADQLEAMTDLDNGPMDSCSAFDADRDVCAKAASVLREIAALGQPTEQKAKD